jgi:DNA polymerase-3 subunit delta
VEQLIRDEITSNGQTISRGAMDMLRPLLGGDRMASRNELKKLALYTLGVPEISLQHVLEVVGDASTFSTDDVIDAVSAGNMSGLEENLDKLLEEGQSPDMLLLNALRHFQLLHELRSKMETGRLSASAVVDGARPPVFYKRKGPLVSSISKLGIPVIEKIIQRFQSAAFEARANPELGRALASTSMLAAILEIRASQS